MKYTWKRGGVNSEGFKEHYLDLGSLKLILETRPRGTSGTSNFEGYYQIEEGPRIHLGSHMVFSAAKYDCMRVFDLVPEKSGLLNENPR